MSKKYLIVCVGVVVAVIFYGVFKFQSMTHVMDLQSVQITELSDELERAVMLNGSIQENINSYEDLLQKHKDLYNILEDEKKYLEKQLEDSDISWMMYDVEQKLGPRAIEVIRQDILEKSDMIEIHKDQPWEMYFTRAEVLSNTLVMGFFEDGHGTGFGIYEYTVSDEGAITWCVIYESMN